MVVLMRTLIAFLLLASTAQAQTDLFSVTPKAAAPGAAKTLLYFTAPWCSPCKTGRLNINALPESWVVRTYDPKAAHPGFNADITIVDLNDHPEMGEDWHVEAVPAYVLIEHQGYGGWKKTASHQGVLTKDEVMRLFNTRTPKAPAIPVPNSMKYPLIPTSAVIRDDVCQCGCGRAGCRCHFTQGTKR